MTVVRMLCCFALLLFACTSFSAEFYGVEGTGDDGEGRIYLINTDDQTAILQFDPGVPFPWFGATDGDDTQTFFATPRGGSLFRIDVDAQTAVEVGPFVSAEINELAYDENNGVLYGTDYISLYQIDKFSGLATLVGSLNGPTEIWAVDYDASIDELVGVNQSDFTMYYIDTATGQATPIGPTGVARITDVWFDSQSGEMFGCGNSPRRIMHLDSSTGQATELFSIEMNILGLGKPQHSPTVIENTTWGRIKSVFR